MIKTSITILLTFMLVYSNAQTVLPEVIKQQFYEGYIYGSVQKWEKGIQQLNELYNQNKEEALLLELAKAEYGAVGACMGKEDTDSGKAHLKKAEDFLGAYLKLNPKSAMANALKSGLLGFKIAFSPMKGMWLGPQSGKYLKKAFEYDDTKPNVWYHKGMYLIHTPSAFGGDPEASVVHFKKAIEIMDQEDCQEGNWEYLEFHAWLGQAYAKVGKKEEAKAIFEKALALEPEFNWVKYALLPKVK